MVTEQEFLMRYEDLQWGMQHICEIPDKTANLLLVFIHRNNGVLSPQYRKDFPCLSDEQISEIEQMYKTAFLL